MRYLLLGAVALAVVACGGASSTHDAASSVRDSPPLARQARELVAFQRNGGLAATLDTVTVRADGSTRSDKRYGGAGRHYDDFRLDPALLRRLRAALAGLPAHLPSAGSGDRDGDTYLLRYGGRTYWARQGAVPAPLRPAVDALSAIADGAGRSGRVTSVRQAPSA
jgi:hypothetical protein